MPSIQASDVQVLEGRVEDVQVAGHYTYLRIGKDQGRQRWAVVIGRPTARVGDALRLKVHGSKTDFHSRRLNRDFDEVFFARVLAEGA